MDSFLAKPLRAADVALLRTHAAAYAEHRALEGEIAAAAAQIAPHETQAALEAAARRAAETHAVLGLHLVAEQQRCSTASVSDGSLMPELSSTLMQGGGSAGGAGQLLPSITQRHD